MIVIRISELRFCGDKGALPYRYVVAAEEWLKHWKPDGNFEWGIANNLEEGVALMRAQLLDTFDRVESNCLLGYKPEHFEFYVQYDEVKNSLFHKPCTSNLKWYKIKEPK